MTGDKVENYDPNTLPDLLPIYYKRLFPYGPYFRWLSYGGVPKSYFMNREFSFTLKDDVYIRYQSFSDQSELEKEIQKRCPYKIDIGAVFSHRPKDHKTIKASAFQAQEKELVFDIDMTDYDDVRTCCSGADICKKCWPLMCIAVRIIDTALRDDFGFEHLLWVYSGRRGVHCWVCDENARKLSQTARSAVAEYLSLVKGGEHKVKKVTLWDGALYPAVKRAVNTCVECFDSYAEKQDFMGTEEREKKVLQLIPDETLRQETETYLTELSKDKALSSMRKWKVIKQQVKTYDGPMKLQRCPEEIILQYTYPRLDVNVSKGVNHLLKSPFCVHPKTGRICVPMDHTNIEDFDPFSVPTISQICEELNQLETNKEDTAKRTKHYRLTSLNSCVEIFDRFVKKLEESRRGKTIEQSDLKHEF